MEFHGHANGSNALATATKSLNVIFIVLISVANLALIVQQLRIPWFYNNAKSMIICSLAIGDLLFALFPLVVMAQLSNGSNLSSMTCRLLTASGTYQNYLIHFVYGIGLVTLGTEVLLRHRIYNINIHKGIIALFASGVPWILGVVIILPLCLANVDFKYSCANSQSLESMLGVSVFFPASLAVFVTAILNFVNFSMLENDQFANSNQSQVIYQPQQPGDQLQNNPSLNTEQAAKQLRVNEQGEYQYPSNQPGVYQYSINPPGVYPYTISQQHTVNILVGSNLTTNTADISMSTRKTEVQMLLVIAIVYFIMVVPVAGIALNARTIVWPDTMTAVVVSQFVYWLMVFRSFLTPLIMLSYSDLLTIITRRYCCCQ